MPPTPAKVAKADVQAQHAVLREQLAIKDQQAADAAATIDELRGQLKAARRELAEQSAITDDVSADLRREAQATQQKKAARLLVVEKLHRDLSAKYDASRAEAARLQVELAAQKAADAEVAAIQKQQVDTLQRDHIALLMQLASMVRVSGVASKRNDVTTEPAETSSGQQTTQQALAAPRIG